jgi:hypothetical protein
MIQQRMDVIFKMSSNVRCGPEDDTIRLWKKESYTQVNWSGSEVHLLIVCWKHMHRISWRTIDGSSPKAQNIYNCVLMDLVWGEIDGICKIKISVNFGPHFQVAILSTCRTLRDNDSVHVNIYFAICTVSTVFQGWRKLVNGDRLVDTVTHFKKVDKVTPSVSK